MDQEDAPGLLPAGPGRSWPSVRHAVSAWRFNARTAHIHQAASFETKFTSAMGLGLPSPRPQALPGRLPRVPCPSGPAKGFSPTPEPSPPPSSAPASAPPKSQSPEALRCRRPNLQPVVELDHIRRVPRRVPLDHHFLDSIRQPLQTLKSTRAFPSLAGRLPSRVSVQSIVSVSARKQFGGR